MTTEQDSPSILNVDETNTNLNLMSMKISKKNDSTDQLKHMNLCASYHEDLVSSIEMNKGKIKQWVETLLHPPEKKIEQQRKSKSSDTKENTLIEKPNHFDFPISPVSVDYLTAPFLLASTPSSFSFSSINNDGNGKKATNEKQNFPENPDSFIKLDMEEELPLFERDINRSLIHFQDLYMNNINVKREILLSRTLLQYHYLKESSIYQKYQKLLTEKKQPDQYNEKIANKQTKSITSNLQSSLVHDDHEDWVLIHNEDLVDQEKIYGEDENDSVQRRTYEDMKILSQEQSQSKKRKLQSFFKFSNIRNSLPIFSSATSNKKRRLKLSFEETGTDSINSTSTERNSPLKQTILLVSEEESQKEYLKYLHRQYLSASLHALFLTPSKIRWPIPLNKHDIDNNTVGSLQREKNFNLHYYQGFHDLASVILLLFTHNECYQTILPSTDSLSSPINEDQVEKNKANEGTQLSDNIKFNPENNTRISSLSIFGFASSVRKRHQRNQSQVFPTISPTTNAFSTVTPSPTSTTTITTTTTTTTRPSTAKTTTIKASDMTSSENIRKDHKGVEEQERIFKDTNTLNIGKIPNLSTSILDCGDYYDHQLAFRVLYTLAYEHIFLRTCMKENFDSLKSLLSLLYPLLERFDSKLASFLRDCHLLGKTARRTKTRGKKIKNPGIISPKTKQRIEGQGEIDNSGKEEEEEIEEDIFPLFTLSWVLTWFAHDVNSLKLATRIYDCVISMHYLSQKKSALSDYKSFVQKENMKEESPCLFVLYICVALLIFHREEVLSLPADFATLHTFLVALPNHEIIFQKKITDDVTNSKKSKSYKFFGQFPGKSKSQSSADGAYVSKKNEKFQKTKINKEKKWDIVLQKARKLSNLYPQEELFHHLKENL